MVITKSLNIGNLIQTVGSNFELSFSKLLWHLQTNLPAGSPGAAISRLIQTKISDLIGIHGELSYANIADFTEAFDLIYGLTNNLGEQKEGAWAIATAIPEQIIAGTEYIYELLNSDITPLKEDELTSFFKKITWINKTMYALILNRLYHIPIEQQDIIFERRLANGLKKYYQLNIDFSFVDVAVKGDLPHIDFCNFREKEVTNLEDLQPLLDSINFDSFTFVGFSILKITDCTVSYTANKFQYMISNLSSYQRHAIFSEVDENIKNILGSSQLQCSLFPIFNLNGVPILKVDVSERSLLFSSSLSKNEDDWQENFSRYLQNPYTIFYQVDHQVDTQESAIVQRLAASAVNGYICFPLRHNDKVVGLLELYTFDTVVLEKGLLAQLSPFFPVLTQLAYDLRLEFKNRLDSIILDNFTALQPAVEWRFNVAGAQYLRDLVDGIENPQMQRIVFPNVYPLYGAIDVKNSTVLRNIAFRKDGKEQLDLLVKIVPENIKQQIQDFHALRSFENRIQQTYGLLLKDSSDLYMQDIANFFNDEVPVFLVAIRGIDAQLDANIDCYLSGCRENKFQDEFELSLQQTNSLVSEELGKLNCFIQQQFPAYFEKFRTDGIEYDFYIGQSLSPNIAFDEGMLDDIRVQQILSMARISQKVQQLAPTLPIPLETTQLVIIHPHTIDISFRQDEKRFDVEGGYNIRYHVIKKRIDKVHIKGTRERLVQPGKIAIVLYGIEEIDTILTKLQLHADGRLMSKRIEYLELEELQGVSGLKALRIDVCS